VIDILINGTNLFVTVKNPSLLQFLKVNEKLEVI